jgi:hypothetical protein
MRRWTFGEFQSQHDAIHFQDLGFGRSIVVEGSTTNQDQGAPGVDKGSHQWNVNVTSDTDFTYGAIYIAKELLKTKLGQIPILVKVSARFMSTVDRAAHAVRIYRFINPPTEGDASNRYRDKTGFITWYEDVYAPYPGQDIEDPPALYIPSQTMLEGERTDWEITSIIQRALRDNVNVDFMVRISSGSPLSVFMETVGKWPLFEFFFFYPIEFYKSDGAGGIDLLSVVDDQPGNEYYLGAVERGQAGAPVQGFFRNYTETTQQVELFDDHPENEEPVQRVGTGTGKLDYIVLADPAVSQLYTLIFYSSTQYEILAVAYRDNPTSLHPQIDADSQWRGTIGSDFTAPTGGLQIPAAAWQPGTLLDDEIEVGVRGNTTVTTWPADSNDQVEMTFDDGGSADGAEWRPVNGRRIKTSAGTTIDATTKLIPTRYVLPTDWPVGTKAFIHNVNNFDAGQVKSIQEADIGSPAFTGTGTDDLSVSGNHNGTVTATYRVEIDAGGTPGTYKWSRNGGAGWVATGIVPTGSPQLLEAGIYVTIPTGTNHDIGDNWDIEIKAFAVELEGLTAGANVYLAGATIGTTLPFRDVAPAVFAQVDADSGASESPPSRVYLGSTAGFTAGDQILIVQAGGSELAETAIIAVGGVYSGYLDLEDSLTNDYTAGDLVTKTGAGHVPFWLRCVANSTTVEQLKTLRLNARML